MISSHSVLVPATPSDPPAPWLGGKKLLARRICRILAATPHDAYAEPFLGMGGVFLRRALKPRVEVINDVAGDVVTLFRVLQRHPEALLRELRWRPAMRVEFDRLKTAREGSDSRGGRAGGPGIPQSPDSQAAGTGPCGSRGWSWTRTARRSGPGRRPSSARIFRTG
jgi:hypothetical protein